MTPTYEQLRKKVRNHRIMWLVFLFFCIIDILAWYGKMDEADALKAEVVKNREIADKWKFEYDQSVSDCQGYKDANQLLLENCDPSARDKAIKATALPKMKGC
jgi:hypothetical protein